MSFTYIVHGDSSEIMDYYPANTSGTSNISAGIIPAYPTEARPHRSRKPRRRRKQRQRTSSCSSDNNESLSRHQHKKRNKKTRTTGNNTMMPTSSKAATDAAPPPPVDYDYAYEQEALGMREMDGAPQVLLWQSSKRRSSISESSNFSDKEDRAAAGDIFRQPSYDRQAAPSSSSASSSAGEEEEPVDLLAPSGPQWFTLDYWRQLLNGNNCCLPKRQRDMDYQPTFGGYPADHENPWLHHQQQYHYQQQQPYYAMPWPQQVASPLAESHYQYHQAQLAAWQQQQHSYSQYQIHRQITEEQTDELLSPVPVSTTSQENHLNNPFPTASQGGRKRHVRTASSLPEVSQAYSFEDDLGFGGDESVSSLESLLSGWKTPQQEYSKTLIPPDTNTTEGTQSTMQSSQFSNRVAKLRGIPGSASPRTSASSKPPVPPLPPISSRGRQHRNQPTTSTMASTALPPLPSPSLAGYTMTPVAPQPSPRDRSFSEASANTSGSRHRRGGTVCEFSFESLSITSNMNNARPQMTRTRSSSLPSEVQIQIRFPTTPEPATSSTTNSRFRLDSNGDDSLIFLDKPKVPPPSQLEEEESGYISPLEEEQFMRMGDRNGATPGSEAYAGDIDDSPQTTATSNSSRNPQDSLCGDEDDEDDDESAGTPTEHRILQGSEEQTSPFAKLKDAQPAAPAGESWMLSWATQDDKPSDAISPTQSPSNSTTNSIGSVVVKRRSSKLPRAEEKVKQKYLPKNLAMEQKWRSNHATTGTEGIALSGWVAFGLGESLVEKLATSNNFDGNRTLLERSDVAYIIAPSASEKLWVSNADGSFEPLVEFRDGRAEVQEISRTHGRAVFIKQNDKTLCTLLPVCLPEHYNGCHQLFDPRQCFPQGAYLPDEQQYTTMHVMFALDALLKANQSWAY